jgi:hypothetical protein
VHAATWLRTHWVSVVELAAIAVVAFAVVVGTSAYAHRRADSATNALYEATKLPAGSDERIAALRAVAKSYGRTFAGKEALMELGEILFKRGDTAGAMEQFQALADSSRNQPMMHIAALHRLANAQLETGKPAEAAATYRKAATDPANPVAAMSSMLAATCLEQSGDYAGAAELYRRIIQDAREGDRAVRDASEGRLLWLQSKGLVGQSQS